MVLHQVASEGRKMSFGSAIAREEFQRLPAADFPESRLLNNFRSQLPVWVAVQQRMSRTPNRMPGCRFARDSTTCPTK
jgi:hypothetical protein